MQGPPGCGKTHVGIRLVQQLLLRQGIPGPILGQGIPGPILVMTYKNHALDEFLMGLLPFVPKQDLVRMGNQSQALFRIRGIRKFLCLQNSDPVPDLKFIGRIRILPSKQAEKLRKLLISTVI
jgi:hypothetical protein